MLYDHNDNNYNKNFQNWAQSHIQSNRFSSKNILESKTTPHTSISHEQTVNSIGWPNSYKFIM